MKIFAMSGGGFSGSAKDVVLDDYALKQCNSATPKVIFVPTASGDSDFYIRKFYESFSRLDCKTSHLSLFHPTSEFAERVKSADLIYVGGGNLKNLLVIWQAYGICDLLRESYKKGAILTGISAGMLCWYRSAFADPVDGKFEILQGLDLLSCSCCVHYDRSKEGRDLFHENIKSGLLEAGYGVDNSAALLYENGHLKEVVSADPDSTAYHISVSKNELVTSKLAANLVY